MQKRQVELLAPAGNIEGFFGAVHAGADAVYLGGSRFGARAYADNFTEEELLTCIRYAHLWGRKVYLTVNTLIKEEEFSDLSEYLKPYYKAGLDGVIVQDIGVLSYVRDHFPGMELHASTQMTLTGVYGTKLVQEMGACRIVPARELSLQEIRHIKEQTGVAVEAFIHGAMCYSYSGQCLFSSILGGRSGNRGRCAQPCRLPYRAEAGGRNSAECYVLSLKDMCTIDSLPELIEAGIDSFKIEGRMKKPEYTAGVTAIYRKYMDQIFAGVFQVDPEDRRKLSRLYIRSELQDGYYERHSGRDMVTLKSPAYNGNDEDLLADIREKYLSKKPRRAVSMTAVFLTGEKASLKISCEGVSVAAEGEIVETASRQPVTKENIERQLSKLGDSIFQVASMKTEVSRDAFYPLRSINELRRMAIRTLEDALIAKNGFIVQRKCPEDNAEESSEKNPQDNPKRLSGGIVPTVSFNALKSEAKRSGEKALRGISLSLQSAGQLQAAADILCAEERNNDGGAVQNVCKSNIRRIYLDSSLLEDQSERILDQCKQLSRCCELVLSLPYIIRKSDYDFLEKDLFPLLNEVFHGIQVRSIEGMGMQKYILRKNNGYQGKLYTDAGFYIWNRETLAEWKRMSGVLADVFCLPLELKGTEQRRLFDTDISCEKIVYGRAPMMLTANCVANTTTGCRKASGDRMAYLTDRYRKVFPVKLHCRECMNIIYNSVPLSLHQEVGVWKDLADLRLDFTVETHRETKEIISYFERLYRTGKEKGIVKPPYIEYTTGHEKRGTE